MTTPTLYPTTSLVAVAWIASIPGLTASGVGTQLPADEMSWAPGGYIVVPFTVGGTPMQNAPVARPVVQAECWATVPNAPDLPWNMAENLAEQIRMATYDRTGVFGRTLTLPAGYPNAWVRSAGVLTHPKRVWSDAGDYAGFLIDLRLTWVAASERIP